VRFLAGAFTLCLPLLAGAALAADMSAPPPVMAAYVPAPVYNWSGCRVGINAGYGWQKDDVYDPLLLADAGGETATGAVGGGQIGCDYQTGSWVFGFQGMFDGTGVVGDHSNPLTFGVPGAEILRTSTPWFATETARIGFTVTPQTLFYVRGGAAEAHFDYSDIDPTTSAVAPYYGTASATRFGWTAGAGVEYALTSNWTAFAEYNYMDFGTHATTFTYISPVPTNAGTYNYNETNRLQMILVGVNFKFSPGGPVIAKY